MTLLLIFVEPFVPYAVRLVATICDLTTPVFNRTVYTQEGKLSCMQLTTSRQLISK